MARGLRWDRANVEYADSAAASNGHIIEAGFVNEGETVTVAHLKWTAHHVAANPADGALLLVCMGMIMGENGWTAANVPDPVDSPNDDWMYYEPGYFQPLLVSDTSGVTQELDVYPIDNGRPIISRSQRKAPVGGANVWFNVTNSSLAPMQSRFYLSLSYSIGILEVS
jgi:hypothetical protein